METFEDYRQALKSEDLYIRVKAVEKLSLCKDNRAVEPLIEALSDPDKYVRHLAIQGLGYLHAQQVVPILIDLIQDSNLDIEAVRALGEIGDSAAIEPLLPLLEDKNRYRREASAGALGQLKAREAFEPLIRLLDDEYGSVRLMALSAIILIGEAYSLPIELYLYKMLNDESKSVQMLAEIKLEELGKT